MANEIMVEPKERLAIEAHNRRVKIKQAIENGTAWLLEAGRLILESVENKDYLALGYQNQNDYFKAEYNIGLSTAHNLMDIWEVFKFLPPKKVAKAGYTRLVRLLPIARQLKNQDQISEWVDKAIELPAGEFENAMKEAKGKTPSDMCNHEFKTILVCKKCGFRVVKDGTDDD